MLRSSAREDIRNKEWTDSHNRQAILCHLKLIRAKEEITRLNVEICRLSTWITDEESTLTTALNLCKARDPLLASALADFTERRHRVNTNLRVSLGVIHGLPGFSGMVEDGEHDGLANLSRASSPHEGSSDEEVDGAVDTIFDGMNRLVLE